MCDGGRSAGKLHPPDAVTEAPRGGWGEVPLGMFEIVSPTARPWRSVSPGPVSLCVSDRVSSGHLCDWVSCLCVWLSLDFFLFEMSFGTACLCVSGCVAGADSGVPVAARCILGAESAPRHPAGFCVSLCHQACVGRLLLVLE